MKVKKKNIKQSWKCPYCSSNVILVDGETVSPTKAGMPIYICSNYPKCDSYVGTHEGTSIPFGNLADRKLRALRRQAHEAFDHFWKGRMSRSCAYKWLADHLEINPKDCHIGLFWDGYCLETIRLCTE